MLSRVSRPMRAEAARLGGGKALRQAIHVARAQAGFTTDRQVADASGVSYDTLMNWYGDKTTPRPTEVKRVAVALGARFADFMAAYEGVDPEPVPLQDAIRDLIEQMRAQMAQQELATMALLRTLNRLAAAEALEIETRAATLSAPSTSSRGQRG